MFVKMASLISDISTPLVNIRAMMQVHKMEGSLIFKLNDYITAVLFITFRIVLYPTLGYRMYRAFELLEVSTWTLTRTPFDNKECRHDHAQSSL